MLQWRQRARLLCFLNVLKNPPMEIGEIIGINLYATQRVLTVACLGFWGTLPNFLQEAKITLFSAEFSTTFGIGDLLLQNWEKYGKSKTIGFITDYLTIFTSHFVGIG